MIKVIAQLCVDMGVDGHRADIAILKTSKTLAAYYKHQEVEAIDVEEAAALVLGERFHKKSLDEEKIKKQIKSSQVIEAVAQYFNLKTTQLKSPTRVKSIALPRQILMYLLRTELGIPLMEVGKLLGGRDHTTIIHGVEKITKLLSTNEDLRVDISGIKQKINLIS